MINRLPDGINRQAIEQLTPETPQQQAGQTASQEAEQPARDPGTNYATSLRSERSTEELFLRSTLDQQLAGTTPQPATQTPPVGVGTPGVGTTGSAASIQRELAFGSQGEDVKTLQTELNKWRAEVGYDPLPVTGFFGDQTKEALKLYQETADIKVDGIFGPVTRDNLTLNNDPNFKKLDFNLQQQVKVQMSSYEKDPDRRRILLSVATNPNFQECNSERTRQAVLNRIENGPITPETEENLKGYLELRSDMAKDPTFTKLTPEVQERIDLQMEQTFDYPTQAKIHGFATEPNFGRLDPAQQNQVIDAFKSSVRFGGGESYNAFMDIIKNPALPGMTGDVQSRILDAAQRNGANGPAVRDLATLVANPLFSSMSPGQQKAAIDAYLMMHPGEVPVGG